MENGTVTSSNLVRLGGLASVMVGVLYASQEYSVWPLVRALARVGDTEGSAAPFVVLFAGLVVSLALGVAAVVSLDARKGPPYGPLATLASLTLGVGVAVVLAGMSAPLHAFSSYLSFYALIGGALVATVGLMALGIVTIAAGVLPWWCGVALIAGPILALSGPLGGVVLVLVGYAVFRTAAHRAEHPSRLGRGGGV